MTTAATATTDELLTVPEVMARLKLGRSTVYDLIRSRRLTSITVGRARRIPVDSVRDFISYEIGEAA
ncbi:helix-turn-helix domain-containing protein [Streptomyces sp. NPDC006482]|uniref:helix-turn-helix domain-containing protein n=1 Tax=Streptomyces sp. NPDC006482 TaxID=3154306 RepID=UPI0033AB4E7B